MKKTAPTRNQNAMNFFGCLRQIGVDQDGLAEERVNRVGAQGKRFGPTGDEQDAVGQPGLLGQMAQGLEALEGQVHNHDTRARPGPEEGVHPDSAAEFDEKTAFEVPCAVLQPLEFGRSGEGQRRGEVRVVGSAAARSVVRVEVGIPIVLGFHGSPAVFGGFGRLIRRTAGARATRSGKRSGCSTWFHPSYPTGV
jgi:hypothetical protein